MIEAYYFPNPILLTKMREQAFVNKKDLLEFFSDNLLPDIKNESLYFELLERELKDLSHDVLVKNKKFIKTALPLEIDQVGSGPTLVALVVGNHRLAEKCNLLGGEYQCVYTFLLEKTEMFIKLKMKNTNPLTKTNLKAFKLLTTDRKAQKYALMCYLYNESHRGRTNRWRENYIKKYFISPDTDNYDLLNKFSVMYEDFLEYVFPNFKSQLKILNKAVNVLVKVNNPVEIKTLDGCLIRMVF